MRPTRWSEILAAFVVAGVLSYVVTQHSYGDVPTPGLVSVLGTALVAVVETYIAVVTRARREGRPGTRAVEPLAIARLAALAKATSLAGGVVTGGYAGFLGSVVRVTSGSIGHDVVTASLGIAAGLLLVAAGLGLERVCRVDDDGDDDDRPAARR